MNKIIGFFLYYFFVGNISAVSAAQTATPIYQSSKADGTFIQVPLLLELYRYTRYSDLSDLSVLDAEGNHLPYQLVL